MNSGYYKDVDGDKWYPNSDGSYRLWYTDGWHSFYKNVPYDMVKETYGPLEWVGDNPPDNRVHFDGGGMRDSENGKPRFDLLIPENVPFENQYLTRIARLMAKGAEHYDDRNWEQFSGPEALNRAKSSAFRHFMQWITGESDEDHAAAIFFNVMAVEHIKGKMS